MTETPRNALAICAQENEWLRGLARSLLADANAAEDIAQDAALVALQEGTENRRGAGWVAGILRNLVASHRRQSVRRHRVERRAAVSEAQSSAEEIAARVEQQRLLADAVLKLGKPFCEVILFRFYDGLTRREIAQRLDVPIATINSRLARAIHRLRDRLDQDFGGDRRGWMIAVAPLATGSPRGVELVLGALMMKKSLAIVAAAIALLGLGVWAMGLTQINVIEEAVAPQALAMTPLASQESLEAGELEAEPGRQPFVAASTSTEGMLRVDVVDEAGVPQTLQLVTARVDGQLLAAEPTDSEGRVHLEHIPDNALISSGSARLKFDPSHWPKTADGIPIMVLTTSVGLHVKGRIVDEVGRPVGGASIWMYRGAPETVESLTSADANGEFVVAGLRSAVLEIRKDGYQVEYSKLLEGEPGTEHEVIIRLKKSQRRLEGVVLGPDGAPWPRARIRVIMERTVSVRRGDSVGREFDAQFDADARGRFVSGWLPAGNGYVIATPGVVGWRGHMPWAAFAPIDMLDQVRVETLLQAVETGEISVRVLDARGTPVNRASISVSSLLSRFGFGKPMSFSGETEAEGNWIVTGLLATDFKVEVARGGDVLQRDVSVVAGQSSHVEFRFDLGKRFEVELVDPGGRPHVGWRVDLQAFQLGARNLTKQTDASGTAHLEGLVADVAYRLNVFHPNQRSRPVWSQTDVDTSGGHMRVQIDEANTKLGGIRGRFIASGAEIRGNAQLVPKRGGRQETAKLDQDGRFEFSSLPPGSYRLLLEAERHVFKSQTVLIEPVEITDLHDFVAEEGSILTVSCSGIDTELAEGLRVSLASSKFGDDLQHDRGMPGTWNYPRPFHPGQYRLVVVGPMTLMQATQVDLVGGVQQIELEPLKSATPVSIRARLMDEWEYGVIGIGQVTIRGEGVSIDERFFGHFDDFDRKLMIRRYGLAPGRYTIEVKGAKGSASQEIEVGTEPLDVDLVVK